MVNHGRQDAKPFTRLSTRQQPMGSRPSSPTPNYVLQSMNPSQPGPVTAQPTPVQQTLPQQPSPSAQQSQTGQQTLPSQQNPPAQPNPPPPTLPMPSKWPTTSTWKLLAWFLGFTLTVLGFIGLKPAFVGEHLARQANAYSNIANAFANESLSLDEWNALLSFKQYCDARLADGQSMAEDCLAAVNMTMPAPPHTSSMLGLAGGHLSKRSAQVVGGMHSIISVAGFMLLLVFEALTANLISVILAIVVFYGGLALFGGLPGTERQHLTKALRRLLPRFISGADAEPDENKSRDDLLTTDWTTSRKYYYPENPRLLDAITAGNARLLRGICRQPGVNLDDRCEPGQATPLIQAVLLGSRLEGYPQHEVTECVDVLLRHGANPDKVDGSKMTALMHACEQGSVGTVRALIASHADVKRTMAPTGITALHLACTGYITTSPKDTAPVLRLPQEYCAIIRCLVSAGADINAPDWHGRTPLHRAMCTGSEERCQAQLVCTLLERGADPYVADDDGRVPRDRSGNDVFDCPALPESLRRRFRHKEPATEPEPEARARQQRGPAKEGP